jgi:hypothetical protein
MFMKTSLVLAAVAALCFAGCKKKEETSSTGTGSAAAATGPAVAKTTPAPTKGKSCEELGGNIQGDHCAVKTPAPVDVAFSGKFDTDMMHPEPGAVFKVTNKLAVPVKIHSAQLYAYDKAGKQLDIDINGSKSKYSQESSMSLIELEPNETKDFVHSIGKKNLAADMDTLQLELLSWSQDGKEFERTITDFEVRPKDGWK